MKTRCRFFFTVFFLLAFLALGHAEVSPYDFPDGQVLVSWVDALRIRAAPDPALPATGFLQTGERATCLGETSTNVMTATLAGRTITAPFVKVKLASGKTGWVFAGGVGRYVPFGRREMRGFDPASGGYSPLQTVIDAARPGDVIVIGRGRYVSRFALKVTNKTNLTIVARGKVEIVCTDSDESVLDIYRSRNVTLIGLTAGHRDAPTCFGHVVRFHESEGLIVRNCDLYGCGYMGVCFLESVSGWIEGNTIRECGGEGIWLADSSRVTILSNRIVRDVCGIDILDSMQVVVSANLIVENETGLNVKMGTFVMNNLYFSNNLFVNNGNHTWDEAYSTNRVIAGRNVVFSGNLFWNRRRERNSANGRGGF